MNAHVVYATITGNNEDIADIISDQLKKHDIEVIETEISQTDAAELQDADICVVCPYTYDEGALPEEGMDFYDDLQDLDLTGKIYGVAGSGDVFYGDDFNKAVDEYSEAFKSAQATQGAENVKIDLEPMEDDVETLAKFTDALVKAAKK
ncbi:flavodoxin [Secundilactobacillus collinoides]|uniref:Flavodoxin n=1 Tax=Secundilactobacillus collinoides TaxID=33960 RepID=A0A161XSH5_SECCO|nr:flavodoxin [Secundilactobacillus collinoides]KZL38047.1 flavodoxin [Secundilactobacillus collinoides]